MKFEFNTEVDGPQEAAALATALAVLHGPAIAKVLDAVEGALETAIDPKAADGYPVTTSEPVPHTARVPAVGEQAVIVDTAGLPWDERIHASTKTTNKDGTWSRRRNTPDATFDTVMAELVAARDGAKEASAPDTSAEEAFAEVNEPEASDQSDPAGRIEADASVVPPPPPPATAAPVSFPQLMVKITKAQTAGKIDKTTVDGFLGTFGLDKIAGLASAGADTIAAVNAMVDEHVGA